MLKTAKELNKEITDDLLNTVSLKDILKEYKEDDIVGYLSMMKANTGWQIIERIIEAYIKEATKYIAETETENSREVKRMNEIRRYRQYLLTFRELPEMIMKSLSDSELTIVDYDLYDPYLDN